MSFPSPEWCMERFPGAALEIGGDGRVLASNGKLDALLGRALTGSPLAEALDESSQRKWGQILGGRESNHPACTWELVFQLPDTMEVRAFLALWHGHGDASRLWLLELAAASQLDRVHGEMAALNSELVESQRALARERNRLAQALEEAQAAVQTRDDVVAVVSHDLRNPLHTIALAAGLLDMDLGDEQRASQIRTIERAVANLTRLIDDLLDVSAMEAGRFSIECSSVDVPMLMEETCALFAARATQKAQRLTCEAAPDLPRVFGDRHRLVQALSNLVGNAVKFTGEGGEIRVHAVSGPGEVVIAVADDGPGIREVDLPHVFKRFWRTGRGKRGGTGLGLAITRGIVDAHGGRIWVESTPGQGATFRFAVPVAGPQERRSGS